MLNSVSLKDEREKSIYAYIDQFETAHQQLKYAWLKWAHDKYEDHGIGSQHNGNTEQFLRTDGRLVLENCESILSEINKEIVAIPEHKTRYEIFRELYYIHPSFHETWFFDEHLSYVVNKLLSGRLGIGVFLSNPAREPGVLNGVATFTLKRTILLENLLANRLDCSLFDTSVLPDDEIVEKYAVFPRQPLNTAEDIAEIMPDIFQIVHTILHRTDYGSLTPQKMLSRAGWLLYALCAVNEGPIIKKISNKKRVEIFSSLTSSDIEEIRTELKRSYEVKAVRSDTELCDFEDDNPISSPIISPRFSTELKPPILSNRNKTSSNSAAFSKDTEDYQKTIAQENGVGELYQYLFTTGKTLFPTYIAMPGSLSFRAKDVMGYSWLDCFNLIPRHSNGQKGLKFQAYIHVLAEYFRLDSDEIVSALPEGPVPWQWRNKTTPDATGIQGYFRSLKEAEKFINCLERNGDC